MKKLITVFFSLAALAVFTSLNAQTDFSSYNDDFSSYPSSASFSDTWKAFGNSMFHGEYYLKYENGAVIGAEFQPDWKSTQTVNETKHYYYFAVLQKMTAINTTAEDTGFSMKLQMNPGTNPFPGVDQNIRLELFYKKPGEQANTLFNYGLSTNTHEIGNDTGSQELEFLVDRGDANGDNTLNFDNITGYQFVFGYDSDAGVGIGEQAILLENITFSSVPEPSAYALLAGLLSLGWISIKRRIR